MSCRCHAGVMKPSVLMCFYTWQPSARSCVNWRMCVR